MKPGQKWNDESDGVKGKLIQTGNWVLNYVAVGKPHLQGYLYMPKKKH